MLNSLNSTIAEVSPMGSFKGGMLRRDSSLSSFDSGSRKLKAELSLSSITASDLQREESSISEMSVPLGLDSYGLLVDREAMLPGAPEFARWRAFVTQR